MTKYYWKVSTTVAGYSYEADLHCIDCTQRRLWSGGFSIENRPDAEGGIDENGIPYRAADREGNLVHPIFEGDECATDQEGDPISDICGDCREIIRDP